MKQQIDIVINDIGLRVASGTTILKAAQEAGIEIPTLCYLKDSDPKSVCRMCVVELDNNSLVPACSTLCRDGMKVSTESDRVVEKRKFVLRMLMTRHLNSCFSCDKYLSCSDRKTGFCNYDKNCFSCGKKDTCKLRGYCLKYNVSKLDIPELAGEQEIEVVGDFLTYDPNHCILCRNCRDTCAEATEDGYIALTGRGSSSKMSFSLCDPDICKDCGKCLDVCPTGALMKQKG